MELETLNKGFRKYKSTIATLEILESQENSSPRGITHRRRTDMECHPFEKKSPCRDMHGHWEACEYNIVAHDQRDQLYP
jgi:hypothetical protein